MSSVASDSEGKVWGGCNTALVSRTGARSEESWDVMVASLKVETCRGHVTQQAKWNYIFSSHNKKR